MSLPSGLYTIIVTQMEAVMTQLGADHEGSMLADVVEALRPWGDAAPSSKQSGCDERE